MLALTDLDIEKLENKITDIQLQIALFPEDLQNIYLKIIAHSTDEFAHIWNTIDIQQKHEIFRVSMIFFDELLKEFLEQKIVLEQFSEIVLRLTSETQLYYKKQIQNHLNSYARYRMRQSHKKYLHPDLMADFDKIIKRIKKIKPSQGEGILFYSSILHPDILNKAGDNRCLIFLLCSFE